MVPVKIVKQKAELTQLEVVKFQLVTYCYFKKVTVSEAVIEMLAHLCIAGTTELSSFCKEMAELKVFASPQVIRNSIISSEEKNLVIKEGKKKMIRIHPALNIEHEGNILLDFKLLCRAIS